MAARKSARQQSPLQPSHARPGVDFQKPLRTPLSRADFLHRTVAASAVSTTAAEDEEVAAMTESGARDKIVFVKVVVAFDKVPASNGKAEAILRCSRLRQSEWRR